MRVAALYDIHGNLPALRAVLAEATREGVGAFVIGGDVAARPLPRETVDQLVSLGARARFVRGNADREIVDAYDRGPTDISELVTQRSAPPPSRPAASRACTGTSSMGSPRRWHWMLTASGPRSSVTAHRGATRKS